MLSIIRAIVRDDRARLSPGMTRIGVVNGYLFGVVCNLSTKTVRSAAAALIGSIGAGSAFAVWSMHQRHQSARSPARALIVFVAELSASSERKYSLGAAIRVRPSARRTSIQQVRPGDGVNSAEYTELHSGSMDGTLRVDPHSPVQRHE